MLSRAHLAHGVTGGDGVQVRRCLRPFLFSSRHMLPNCPTSPRQARWTIWRRWTNLANIKGVASVHIIPPLPSIRPMSDSSTQRQLDPDSPEDPAEPGGLQAKSNKSVCGAKGADSLGCKTLVCVVRNVTGLPSRKLIKIHNLRAGRCHQASQILERRASELKRAALPQPAQLLPDD
jgi:hypothetical protein